MKLFSQAILLLALSLLLPHAAQATRRLSIKSDPSGASVDIGRVGTIEAVNSIGVTPILSEIDDYWFDGPSSSEIQFLAEPVVMTIRKEGYESKTELITKGPFEWASSDGTIKKRYYVLVSADFNFKLEPAKSSAILSGPPQPAFIPPANATWYRRAPDEINQKAKLKLERALSIKAADINVDDLFSGAVVCGPILWEALKGQAGKELQESLALDFVTTIPGQATKEGRSFSKLEQKQSFWNAFIEKIKGNNSAVIRRASKVEVDYYWSTISFDIEEPLYVVDLGNRKVLFNFAVKNSEPKIFWMDIVGDMAGVTRK
jgi:hypothetical protein